MSKNKDGSQRGKGDKRKKSSKKECNCLEDIPKRILSRLYKSLIYVLYKLVYFSFFWLLYIFRDILYDLVSILPFGWIVSIIQFNLIYYVGSLLLFHYCLEYGGKGLRGGGKRRR